jgi:predicted esterase
MVRAAYDYLMSRPEVDASRTAFVGHDFGAMYESVVFAGDERPLGLVMMAPTARWADWFYKYWPISDDEAAYSAAFRPHDPVEVLHDTGGRPVLLQFGQNDRFVTPDVAQAISAAAGESGDSRTYDSDHELNVVARTERDAWLADLLHLPPTE